MSPSANTPADAAFVAPLPLTRPRARARAALRATTFRPSRLGRRASLAPAAPAPRAAGAAPRMAIADVNKSDVFMPALSSTMTEGKIVQWLKQPGDAVAVGEPIMVVESDKADMDVESFEAGYLAHIAVAEGDSAPVGDVVGIIVASKDDVAAVQAAADASAPPPSMAASNGAPPPMPAAAAPAPAAAPAAAADAPPKPPLVEVFMPALSSTMTEGKVVEWLKNEGDSVNAGEMIMVVESDKADMDVESFDAGVLAHVAVDAGDSAPVGDPVAFLAKSAADVAAVKAWALAQGGPSAPAAPAAAEPASAPAAAAPAPAAPAAAPAQAVVNEGRIVASPLAKSIAKAEGVDLKYVKGTGPGGRIVKDDVLAAKAGGAAAPAAAPASPAAASGKIIATPDAKKVAKKEKIDLASVTGTGNFGRITADDVLRAAGKAPVAAKADKPAAGKAETKAAPAKAAPAEMPAGAVAMNAMQKAVVQNMNASLDVPVFRITYKIKTTALDELYAKVKPKGVTMSALLAKAVAATLTKHPIMNAAYADNAIVYRPEINVAMAVAMPDGGLITPTLKDAANVDLYSLSRSWKDLVKRAGEKKLAPDEYSSGTFFISNLGMFGVEQFDAILPPGAPAILAIGASKPVVSMQANGLVAVAKEMSVTLTADHRHIYGADGANFLKDLAALLEGDVTELLM